MKIAMIADRLELGGVESHIISLINGLLGRGHQILLNTAAASDDLLAQIQSQNGEFFHVSWSANPVEDLRDFNPDIIHAHPFTALIRGYQAAMDLKKPFFITMHGLYDFGVDRSPLGFSIGEKASAIIAVDLGVANLLKNNVSFPDKVQVIFNGIDLNNFQPLQFIGSEQRAQYGLNPNWFTLVVISRLGDGKEIPIIELVKYIPKWGIQLRGINLVIVGDGSGMSKLLETIQYIHSPGFHYQVIAVGRQTDIRPYLSIADLVLACDRAALEAMACQRPVLAMNANGFAGIIDKNNYETILFQRQGYQPMKEKDLTKTIIILAKKKKYRAKIALHSCSIVHRFFDLKKTIIKVEDLYQKALAEK